MRSEPKTEERVAVPPYSDSDARRRAFAFEPELEYADGITRLRSDFTDFQLVRAAVVTTLRWR